MLVQTLRVVLPFLQITSRADPTDTGKRQTRGRTVRNGEGHWAQFGLLVSVFFFLAGSAFAAPYASIVVDARSGEVLAETNADTRLHPASLTKMMTLYIGSRRSRTARSPSIPRCGSRTMPRRAAVPAWDCARAEDRTALPDPRGGDQVGQRCRLRHRRGDPAVGGSLRPRMNRTAQALGMSDTTFNNANGLTRRAPLHRAGHDHAGRHLFYDFPATTTSSRASRRTRAERCEHQPPLPSLLLRARTGSRPATPRRRLQPDRLRHATTSRSSPRSSAAPPPPRGTRTWWNCSTAASAGA